MKRWFGPIAGLGLLVATGPVQAIPTIDTLSSWNGSSSVHPFGEPNVATFGQTFTVTEAETQLESFTFLVNDFENPDVIEFQAFVYEWDVNTIVGPELFSSGNLSTLSDNDNGFFETFTITTEGINLEAGSQYVAFFSALNLFDGEFGGGSLAYHQDPNPYLDGHFVFNNNVTSFGFLSQTSWSNNGNADLAFTATFSVPQQVSEPSAIVILSISLLTIGALARRRRQS